MLLSNYIALREMSRYNNFSDTCFWHIKAGSGR